MFGHGSWDTSRIGFSSEARKAPPSSAKTRVFTATTNGIGVQTQAKPGSKVNCEVSEWTEWTLTGDECQEIRTRTITTQPKCNGKECPHLEEKNSMNPSDAVWDWGEWKDDQSDPCQQIRVRVVVSKAKCGGRVDDPQFPSGESSLDE